MAHPVMECRCGAPLRWEKTIHGANIPLDEEPVPDGPLVLIEDDDGHLTAVPFNSEYHQGMPRFRTHFESCPEAKRRNPKP